MPWSWEGVAELWASWGVLLAFEGYFGEGPAGSLKERAVEK